MPMLLTYRFWKIVFTDLCDRKWWKKQRHWSSEMDWWFPKRYR